MQKLFLILFALVPYLLKAQVATPPADSIAAYQKSGDFIVKADKNDVDFANHLPQKSNTLVTDYTNTLTAAQTDSLELKLETFNKKTTDQIAVVIINTVGVNDIMLYGRKLANSWGIGQKGKNNGILVLVAMSDRKTAILTGRGLERAIPDIKANHIIQTVMIPNFKMHAYYTGLDQCTSDLIKYIMAKNKPAN